MTIRQINIALERYKKRLKLNYPEIDPVRIDPEIRIELQEGVVPYHVAAYMLWMCDEIPNLIEAGKIEKTMRWLGFLQATMWMLGHETLESLKGDNRKRR